MDKNNKAAGAVQIDGNLRISLQNDSKVVFINELRIRNIKVPVRTELDFSNVDKEWHEEVLEVAKGIYHKDTEIKMYSEVNNNNHE